MWERYCRGVNAVVYVVDAAGVTRNPQLQTQNPKP
jgi:hypothetical protein